MTPLDVVILSPVMPVWDDGQFCAPLVELLMRKGLKVSVIDTLSLIHTTDPEEAVDLVHQALMQRVQAPFLLVGFAMAGTLVQLLSHKMQCLTGVMSVSAPGYADPQLKARLGQLISLLDSGEVEKALDELHQFVVPTGQLAQPIEIELTGAVRQHAIDRMSRGFRLLLNCDARKAMAQYHGKYLGIVGEKSQLATWHNQTHSTGSGHRYAHIPEAGMRPWNDNPAAISILVNEWIDEL